MKRLLMCMGIISIVACILLLIYAFLMRSAYYRMLDGTSAHYAMLRRRMMYSFAGAVALAVFGAVCIVFSRRM